METIDLFAPLLLGFLACFLSYVGILALLHWTHDSRQLIDIPNERSSHSRPTPRGGGLPMVMITLVGAMVALIWTDAPGTATAILSFVAGGGVVAGISWLDDWRSLSNRVRFSAHLIAAVVIVVLIGSWRNVTIPLFGTVALGWVGVLCTLFWITGLTNAYNFMDGIDGLAGVQAVVAGLGYALLGILLLQPAILLLGVLIAAASAGFLGHNWHPARVFMGDVGSAFLGYSFAVLPLVAMSFVPDADLSARLLVVAILFVWPFLFDAGFTFLRRLINRERVWEAHRSHLYQRLVMAGYQHNQVALIYSALAAIGGALGLMWLFGLPIAALGVMIGLPLMAFGLWRYVSQSETQAVMS